ncbi:MAG: hypothetical protein JWM86_2550 [Thermoleophilia bacterium]|nr:hypothetical protein [Thermoleophilia bacterium]
MRPLSPQPKARPMQLALRTPQPIDPTPPVATQPLLGGLRDMLGRPGDAGTPATPVAPVEESQSARAGAAELFGRVGGAQQRSIETQQSLALLSATLGARLGTLGSHVWSLLRGTADPEG